MYHSILRRVSRKTQVEFRLGLQSFTTSGKGNSNRMYDLNNTVCDGDGGGVAEREARDQDGYRSTAIPITRLRFSWMASY